MASIYIQPCDVFSNKTKNYESTTTTTTSTNVSKNDQLYLQEIKLLRQQVQELQRKQDHLEAEKEELINQAADLRQLMKRVNQENDKKLQRFEKKNAELTDRISGLEFALQASFEDTAHFELMAEYFADANKY